MGRGRAIILVSVCLAAGCATVLGIEDTTDDQMASPDAGTTTPGADVSEPPDSPSPTLPDFGGSAEDPGETPAVEDAGTYAVVEQIDAQVTTCAEPGLVARWKIDEGVGDVVADCSGNKLHGRATNATWTSNGASGKALQFRGKGWIGFANPALLRITGAITVAAWIRADKQTSETEYLVGKSSNSSTNGWRLGLIDSTRQIAFATPSSAGYFNVVGGSVPIGAWKHVAALFAPGSHSQLYMNGVKVGSHTSGIQNAMVSSSAEARVGARFDGEYGFTGAVSDVRVYNRALSATEISAIAKR